VATFLTYLLGLLVVGGALFLIASFSFGRGEQLAPAPPDGTPVELPDGRLAGGDDLRRLRLSVVLRGYRMEEVDWVLAELADQLDERDREIARLRGEPVPAPAADGRVDPDRPDPDDSDPDRTDPDLADEELAAAELAAAERADRELADAEGSGERPAEPVAAGRPGPAPGEPVDDAADD
jgi:DivIVA domain-containing protein